MEDLIFDYKDPILKDVFIFDYYPNKNTNEIKIGFRFTFQSNYSTLTVEEVDDVMNNIKDITLKIDLVEILAFSMYHNKKLISRKYPLMLVFLN